MFCKNVFLDKKSLEIRASTVRPELSYQVLPIDTSSLGVSSFTALIRLVAHLKKTLAERDRIMVFFKNNSLAETFAEKTHCAVYHSKLPISGNTKDYNLFRWDSGDTKVLAATTAVAQGIHRGYVKHVIFFEGAYGAISFYQGAGRAGRQGEPSFVFIVYDTRVVQCVRDGWKSVKDTSCDSAFVALSKNFTFCRTEMLSSIMDGDKLSKKCTSIPGCNLCDVCDPDSEMALLARYAIKTPPPPPTALKVVTPPSLPITVSGESEDGMFEFMEITSSVARELDSIANTELKKVWISVE